MAVTAAHYATEPDKLAYRDPETKLLYDRKFARRAELDGPTSATAGDEVLVEFGGIHNHADAEGREIQPNAGAESGLTELRQVTEVRETDEGTNYATETVTGDEAVFDEDESETSVVDGVKGVSPD